MSSISTGIALEKQDNATFGMVNVESVSGLKKVLTWVVVGVEAVLLQTSQRRSWARRGRLHVVAAAYCAYLLPFGPR